MKTDFSINIQVNLGVTPEIVALVNAILCHRPTVAPTAEEAAADKPEPTKEPAGDEQQEAAANEADANGEQVAEQREAKAEEAAPQDGGQAEAQAERKPLTAEDVRAAMHATRQRIEGEDYKENTNGDLYKKYHKPLTAQFKNIAALLGAEKPSALPSDKIANFIEQCNGLQVMEDGTIGSNCPF